MKRTLKKTMSILLAFMLVFGSFAFGLADGKFADFALKAEAETIGYFTFTNGGVDLLSVSQAASGHIVIPSYVNDNPVTGIRDHAFSNCTAIESVTFSDNISYVGDYAFSGCTSLESVKLSANLKALSAFMFKNCTSLKSIVIPNGATNIGGHAFENCKSLTSVNIPDSVENIYSSAFDGCEKLESITIPKNVTEISGSVFDGCESLTNVTILGDITKIGSYAFSNCKKLKNITIPDTVTKIDQCAFIGCVELESINLPENVTEIGSSAFSGCEKLEGITIPAAVTSIGSSAFYGCNALKSITVESENIAYSSDECGALFNKEKTKLIQYPAGSINEIYILPDCVTAVDYYAFNNCSSLKTIVFPDGVTKLVATNVWNCANLECVHIPKSVTSISSNFIKDTNAYICSTTENCSAKEFADANGFEFRVCNGNHNGVAPEEPTTKPAVTEPSTTKPVIEPTTKPVVTEPSTTKPVEVPTTTKPEPTTKPSGGFIFRILKPSVSVIKYGETLILHTNLTSVSAEEKIEWSVDGEGVTIKPSADGLTCAVTSTATDEVTVTAKYTDANGVEHISEQEIESNASFWQKIVSFFKNLFGINRIIEQRIRFDR